MALNWINPEDYSFNCILLMERFQLRMMMSEWHGKSDDCKYNMGVALNANLAVKWYMERKCPEHADALSEIASTAKVCIDAAEIRNAEVYVLASIEDWVTHTTPEVMATKCPYIRDWDKERLYEMADFKDKVVLDVGSGSGRLTFAAAVYAKEVYASEPVETLREFIRSKAKRENITNIRVTEALVTSIPYPDNTFDIVMSGHVVGDEIDEEIAELTRVCKPGGWLLACPGEGSGPYDQLDEPDEQVTRGWERMRYIGNCGSAIDRYRKQVFK